MSLDYLNSLTFEQLALEFGSYLWKLDEPNWTVNNGMKEYTSDTYLKWMNSAQSTTGLTFQDSFSNFNAVGLERLAVPRSGIFQINTTANHADRLTLPGNITVGFLYKTGTNTGVDAGYNAMFEIYGGDNLILQLALNNGNQRGLAYWQYGASQNQFVESSNGLMPDSSEIYLCVTRNDDTQEVKFYTNGTLFQTIPYANPCTNADLGIDDVHILSTDIGSNDAYGTMANLMVKPGVLEPDQIQLLYQKQL